LAPTAYRAKCFRWAEGAERLVETSLGPENIKVDLRNASSNVHQVFVNMPGSPALPVPFAVGDDPEVNGASG